MTESDDGVTDKIQSDPLAELSSSQPKGSMVVSLGEYVIYCDQRIDIYSNGPVKAYAAGLKREGEARMFALVCEPFYAPRFHDINRYQMLSLHSCVTLKIRGVAYWPPAKEERYIIIYNGGIGRPLLPRGEPMHLGLKQNIVLDYVAKSLIDLLHNFQNKNFVHGAIRADNIFDGGSRDMKNIVLGDGVCLPPSLSQPVLYETIQRGMADPVARGLGTGADDLYALGITLAVLMRQNDPMEGLSDHDVVRRKIEYGSYLAVTGKGRFTGAISDLIRGLLNDEMEQRWALDEVLIWMDGQRVSPKPIRRDVKASRAFIFNNTKYIRPSILAMDLDKNPSELVTIVQDGSLLQWVEHSVQDVEAANRLKDIIETLSSKAHSIGYGEVLVSLVSAALDAFAPIRYNGMAIDVGGLGAIFSEKIGKKKNIKPLVDLFLKDIIFKYIINNESNMFDKSSLKQIYDSCHRSLCKSTMGEGVEKCVYILNQYSMCYSEKLKGYYVTNLEEFLKAVEKLCAKDELEGVILDRHMMAFLSVRESRVIDSFLFDLNSTNHSQKVLGNLQVFAAIQKRLRVSSLQGLAKVFYNSLPILLNGYHDKFIREEIKKSAALHMKAGNLIEMEALLSNSVTKNKDHNGFLSAIKEYSLIENQHNELKERLKNSDNFGVVIGQDFSAIFACVLSFIIVCLIAFSFF